MTDYSTLLRERITLSYRSFDRIFLQAWVPKLQSVGQVCIFLNSQRGFPIPSSALFGRIGRAYVEEIHRFAADNQIPVVYFKKGENKEDRAKAYLQQAAKEGRGKVVMLGIDQEKASVWKSWVPKSQRHLPHPHVEWGRQMSGPINHFYFYIWDEDFGPSFIKTNAYAPYPIWVCLNGHEWAKRQLDKKGIDYTELDNGFASCEDPKAGPNREERSSKE